MSRYVAALLLAIAPTGCFIFADDPKRDGASCHHDDECESSVCKGGMCTASSCNVTSNCQSGFTCDMAPTWLEVASLGAAKGVCLPDCDTCPSDENPRWICGGSTCSYDANPRLEISAPTEAIVGDPIALAVDVELDHDRELGTISWTWNGMVVSTERTAEITPELPGTISVELTVTDDDYGYASATATIAVCAEQGDACYYVGDCCTGLSCGTNGSCE